MTSRYPHQKSETGSCSLRRYNTWYNSCLLPIGTPSTPSSPSSLLLPTIQRIPSPLQVGFPSKSIVEIYDGALTFSVMQK